MILSKGQRESSERLLLSVFTVVLATLITGNLVKEEGFNFPVALWGIGIDIVVTATILYLRRRD